LLKPESDILKSKSQKNKTVMASGKSELKGVIPEVLINQKLSKPHLKLQEVKSKTSSTNLKGPIKQWVPGQQLLKTYDMREVNVPHSHNERRRKCEVWRQPVWQDH